MDFVPFEGVPLEGGQEWKRLMLAVAIGAVMVMGAWVLLGASPISTTRSVSEARMIAPSTTAGVNIAASDTDVGPGEAESELCKHPVAAR